jgi:hypothetical protein
MILVKNMLSGRMPIINFWFGGHYIFVDTVIFVASV